MSMKEKWLEVAKKDLTEQLGEGEWNEWGVDHPDFEEWLEEMEVDLSRPFYT